MKRFRALFLLAFCGVALADGPVPPGTDLIPNRVFGFQGGMEDHLSTFLTQNAKYVLNLHLNNVGELTTRTGYTKNGFLTNSSPVTGGGYHTAQTGTSFFAVVIGTGIYRTSNAFGGSYSDVTGGLTVTASTTNLVQSASLNDKRVFCNELDAPFELSSAGNATALSGSPPSLAKTVCTFYGYMFFGNTKEGGVTYPCRLRWSDPNTSDSWPANNYQDLDTNDGDSIISMATIGRSLIVFKKRSIWQVTITGLPGANAFSFRPVARNLGCWAKNSVQSIAEHGIFFQGQDGVYQIGGFDYFGYPQIKQISYPIYNEFQKISHSNFSISASGYLRKYNQYWLSISTAGTTNGEILVYDYVLGEKSENKAWSVYSGINANMLAVAEDNQSNEILLSGDYNGYVYKQDVGNSDNPLNVSTNISFIYTSQELPLSSPDLDKQLTYLYTFATTTLSTVTLTMNLAYDFATSYADTFSTILGTSGALWNTAVWNTDIWPGLDTYTTYRINVGRDHIKTYRLQYAGSTNKTTAVRILGYSMIWKPQDWGG